MINYNFFFFFPSKRVCGFESKYCNSSSNVEQIGHVLDDENNNFKAKTTVQILEKHFLSDSAEKKCQDSLFSLFLAQVAFILIS